MTARRKGPRATRGSKTSSGSPRARTKTGAGKKAPARKKPAASRSETGDAKRSPARKAAASTSASPSGSRAGSQKARRKKSGAKNAARKKSLRKKTVRKKAVRKKATAPKPKRKKTARNNAARARPTSPRAFRIAATRAREVGTIGRAYTRALAAVLELSGELRVGDWIAVRGATTDFTQRVASLHLEGRSVENAGAGDTVGIATSERTRVGDRVERLDP